MNIAQKRRLVEVLLAVGDPCSQVSATSAPDEIGCSDAVSNAAYDAWSAVDLEPPYVHDWSIVGISAAYTEAAYRLIESSPTLIREWFGVAR